MTSTKLSPLHLEAPRLVADAALGEHLAALARASAPSAASRVRRSGWRVPLAAVATIAASSSVAYASQAALDGQTQSPTPTASEGPANDAASAVADAANAAFAAVPHGWTLFTNPHGKIVGRGHPKTGKALGHPGEHDAGNRTGDKHQRAAPSPTQLIETSWRKSAGSAGVLTP